ncbi:MAG: hypothetical protein ABIR78_06430 [Ferruginibacter sp.]
MSIPEFISKQPPERQQLLAAIHQIIIQEDKNVAPGVGLMMGKEMILYNAPGIFKYGLSSVKNYMSLHVMPIYASPVLYSRYKAILDKAVFQKGCINFKTAEEMPLKIVEQLMADCSKIDLRAMKEAYLRSKKS